VVSIKTFQNHRIEDIIRQNISYGQRLTIGAPLIKRELEKLNLKSEIFRMRCFILVCTKVLNKENPIYDESKWFRKWEQQKFIKFVKL
jgi:hypothetical protein